jgi:hypothetical protein
MNEILQAIYPIAAKHTKKIPNATIWPGKNLYEQTVLTILNTITIQWTTTTTVFCENHNECPPFKILTCHFEITITPGTIYIRVQDFISHTIPLTDPQAIQKLEQYLEQYHHNI